MKPIGYLEIALLKSRINIDIKLNIYNANHYDFLYEYQYFLSMLIKSKKDIIVLRENGIITFGQEYDEIFMNIVNRRLRKIGFTNTDFFKNCYIDFFKYYNCLPKWLLNKLIRYFLNDFPSFFFNTIVLFFTLIQIPQLIFAIIK
jgi:hypothetical protein